MASENLSYSFLCALGIERNLKVWVIDRRYLITRRRACIITLLIIIFVYIHDHLFLFLPYDFSYCFIKFYDPSIIFSCDNAYYKSYGYKYSLTDLIFIESIGLNNCILPILIILTNILLIFGLRRRAYRRRSHLGRRTNHDWKERSVILYIFFSSITFIFLTSPIGILNAWSAIYSQKLATNNLSILLDLLEILHHCSHFPILLMTSSVIRTKTLQILFQPFQSRRNSTIRRQSSQKQVRWRSSTA